MKVLVVLAALVVAAAVVVIIRNAIAQYGTRKTAKEIVKELEALAAGLEAGTVNAKIIVVKVRRTPPQEQETTPETEQGEEIEKPLET